ncbi:MAG: putative manganese-dependent inorganic diphosphatase [Bacillota bacterium]
MTRPVYIVGHKNPDTDSICSAIAYAHLKNELGIEAVPFRAGDVNRETRYVLDYFKVAEPELLPDLKTRVKDLLTGENVTVNPEMPLLEAWMLMRSRQVKTLPVVDRGNHLLGLVTAGDLADKYLADLGEQNPGEMQVTAENIRKTLSGTLLNGSPGTELKGRVVIGAMQSKLMEQHATDGCFVLVDEDEEQLAALETGASCLILAGGAELHPDVRAEVIARGITVIQVPMDIFTASRMILTSVPVGSIMLTGDILVFNEDDLLDDVRKTMLETRFRNYPVVDEQNRVVGEISRYHLLGFSRKKVILVDHNELSQAVEGTEEARIIEVVDHHRVGGIQTGEPILFRNEPVGSTCTLIARAYFEHGIALSREIAGILCAGILSDTVIFKSPTCTPADRDMAGRLGDIAGIDPVGFGVAMFKEASSLSGRTPHDILNTDFKKFAVGELQMGIGQVSTMGLDEITAMKQELLVEMESVRRQSTLDYVLLMATDLLAEATSLLIAGPNQDLIGKAFNGQVTDQQVYLPGVLSRKKQVVPPLMKYFNQ